MGGRLADKVAVITGAAKGQGAGVARRFVAEGARVALLDVLDDTGTALAAELGAAARFLHCDIAREEQVAGAIDAATRHFGGLDVLYNNAAVIAYGRRIAELPTAEWDRTLAINLRGPFLCAKYALPHLVARGGGAIINVSSHGAFQASPTGVADYAVAKGGLVTLTYYLASEYGHEQVRANCIAPGPVPTDLNAPFLGTEEGRAQTAMWIPLGRVGAIDDIANAAVFLASDEARWITGAVLRVDGGMVVQ
ncbi:MAG TPA: SDR family oxidoreductase [Candidatus Dormibacteraeota bacterium]|nr:SDR family oxidoreductase [Candidatus Dormibacteraeota bacterium]